MFMRSAVTIHLALMGLADRLAIRFERDEDGQSTAEYALVLLGAAAVAMLLVAWATKSNRVGKLLDLVFDQLTDRAEA